MPLSPATLQRLPTAWPALAAALILAGCASGPSPRSDSAPKQPPPDLVQVPDAEPRIEPIRRGGPNKPYTVLGQSYTPLTDDAAVVEAGQASWYGNKFHGRRTASGEVYNMYAMTAAHRTLPIPSYARVRNPANGREVIVRVNDRGPFHSNRIIDLSYTAALKLDMVGHGVAKVEVERLTFDVIRTGAWRRGEPDVQMAAVSRPEPRPEPPIAPLVTPAAPVPPVTPTAAQATDPVSAQTSAQTTPQAAELASPLTTAAAPPAPALREEQARAYTGPAEGFWVQLGAFRKLDGAEAFRRRVAEEVDAIAPLLAVFNESALFRLQAGPYASRGEARSVAEQVRTALDLVPVIVERR